MQIQALLFLGVRLMLLSLAPRLWWISLLSWANGVMFQLVLSAHVERSLLSRQPAGLAAVDRD